MGAAWLETKQNPPLNMGLFVAEVVLTAEAVKTTTFDPDVAANTGFLTLRIM
jgi:hypothetical protein